MSDDVFRLFDEYAASFARGERPDTREYLSRAGEARDELGRLIEQYLERVPPPEPDEASVALARAWLAEEPPLLELRKARRLRVDDVVDRLMTALALDPGKRAKVKRYYQQLEGGVLEPGGVSRRVWDALAETLKARASDLAAWRARPVRAALMYRTDAAITTPASMPMPADPEPRDEVDELFAGTGEPPQ